jgi:hypothetical protein
MYQDKQSFFVHFHLFRWQLILINIQDWFVDIHSFLVELWINDQMLLHSTWKQEQKNCQFSIEYYFNLTFIICNFSISRSNSNSWFLPIASALSIKIIKQFKNYSIFTKQSFLDEMDIIHNHILNLLHYSYLLFFLQFLTNDNISKTFSLIENIRIYFRATSASILW